MIEDFGSNQTLFFLFIMIVTAVFAGFFAGFFDMETIELIYIVLIYLFLNEKNQHIFPRRVAKKH